MFRAQSPASSYKESSCIGLQACHPSQGVIHNQGTFPPPSNLLKATMSHLETPNVPPQPQTTYSDPPMIVIQKCWEDYTLELPWNTKPQDPELSICQCLTMCALTYRSEMEKKKNRGRRGSSSAKDEENGGHEDGRGHRRRRKSAILQYGSLPPLPTDNL